MGFFSDLFGGTEDAETRYWRRRERRERQQEERDRRDAIQQRKLEKWKEREAMRRWGSSYTKGVDWKIPPSRRAEDRWW